MKRYLFPSVFALTLCMASVRAQGPDADEYLSTGKFDEGIVALKSHLKTQPKDDRARFGLAWIQVLQGIQRLTQNLSAYGVRTYNESHFQSLFGTAPRPKELLTYPRLRQIIQIWLDDLGSVESTLAAIEAADVKLPLRIARIPLRLSATSTEVVTLVSFLRENSVGQPDREADFVICFDRADVEWMRGYCHLLAALAEMSLAYDGQELFDVAASRIFKHVENRYPFLLEEAEAYEKKAIGSDRVLDGKPLQFEELPDPNLVFGLAMDVIASIHVMRFPIAEPKRMAAALAHLEQVLTFSRQMWTRVLAETDDDREWIPSPKQKAAIGLEVTQRMIDQWQLALDESQSILQGKKLLPFWRGTASRGVNLRKMFLEPRNFDVILWVQGTGAAPYLEEGEVTRPDTWENINEAFNHGLLTFGLWFN